MGWSQASHTVSTLNCLDSSLWPLWCRTVGGLGSFFFFIFLGGCDQRQTIFGDYKYWSENASIAMIMIKVIIQHHLTLTSVSFFTMSCWLLQHGMIKLHTSQQVALPWLHKFIEKTFKLVDSNLYQRWWIIYWLVGIDNTFHDISEVVDEVIKRHHISMISVWNWLQEWLKCLLWVVILMEYSTQHEWCH